MADVSYPHRVMVKLRTWATLAALVGRSDEFTAALREMDARLRADPEAWGDPINNLQTLRLTLYLRAGPVLIVSYAIHANGTPVLVQDVRLTPGSPISRAGGYPP